MLKRLITILFTILALASCGKGQVSEGDLPNCYQEDQSGQYIMSFAVEESNCGFIPLMSVKIDKGVIYPEEDSGCVIKSSVWDRADCRTTTEVVCEDDESHMFLAWALISFEEDGSRLTGKLYLTVEEYQTDYNCEGTYNLNSRKVDELEEE